MNSKNAIADIKKQADPEKASLLQRYFKTGKGEYGEGDKFLGLKVPEVRKVAKKYKDLKLDETEKLIQNPAHEVRLCGLMILVDRFESNPDQVHKLYLKNTKYINNWDLVDTSASGIVGAYIFKNKNYQLLTKLAKSLSIWERRIAIIATYYFIKQGISSQTFRIATLLLNDKHDLIHKAVGWMLREVGQRVSQVDLENFLEKNFSHMPRTTLRYSIEKFSTEKRAYYLNKKVTQDKVEI